MLAFAGQYQTLPDIDPHPIQFSPVFQATDTASKVERRIRAGDSSRDRQYQTSTHQKSRSSLALERSSYPIKIFILFDSVRAGRVRTTRSQMSDFLSREESRELIRLCQTGRLHDVRSWIEAGKSLRTAPEIKKTILSVAVKTGFHSLVELIALQETQEAKNQGLADAVRLNRLDLVELLVSLGADIKAVPFSDVLLNWHPHIIRFFIDHGADLITGSPFAKAFGEKIRTALRPFMECKQRFPDLADALQEQADRALRKFAYEGDLKWVSLLTWAGSDPRSRGIRLGDENFGTAEDRAKIATTALMEACYQKNLDVLKKLKLDPKRDNLSELLACASTLSRTEIIKYLLGLGAQPNDKANGGSSALDRSLGHLAHEDFDAVLYKRPVSRWKVQNTMDSLKVLVNHGALWKPDSPRKRRTTCVETFTVRNQKSHLICSNCL